MRHRTVAGRLPRSCVSPCSWWLSSAARGVGIRQFNVESEPELEVLSEVATAMGRTAPITVRVNPDVDAKTHANISTGRTGHKFGIDYDQAADCFLKSGNSAQAS